ncbi:MAG: signal recognition particle receptor subunit alpha [Nanoarchaeota archaeon]|nr:signal recognition particle receptor subunit alpha [Nanoarchaeota archaeon]
MLEKLGEILRKATDRIANALFLDKNLVDQVIRDLQRALIEADVSISLVKELSDKIRKAAIDERIREIDKKEHIIKLLHDELVSLLGEYKPLALQKTQNRIMFLGLYGAGKTTMITKLGNYYAKRGNKVALIGLDVHRPAAAEQLEQNAKKHNLNYFIDPGNNDAVSIYKKYEKQLKTFNVILIDTAGRHMLDETLLKEIKELNRAINPTEKILVMPADVGQAAKKQAKEFQGAVEISGVIITRMDSTAKGGGALTACAETKAGVYFIGTGEKVNDVEEFNPERFLSRLLGMGDLQSLIEKIKSITDEKAQAKLQKGIEQGKLSLDDVVAQVKSMGDMGGFDKIKGMIPGLNSAKIPEGMLESQQAKISRWEHILKSMTPEEKADPEILQKEHSRINRIAKGSGVANSDIKALLKQYDMLNEMIKSQEDFDPSKGMSQKQMQKLAKKFGKVKKMRF